VAGETPFVFILLLVTIILFVSDRLRLDVVAVLVLLALMISGLLTPKEALAGFSDPVVLLIAGLSAFMSSTGAVAIFIPVTLNLAAKAGI
jgi:di/tricarboxylate transporter